MSKKETKEKLETAGSLKYMLIWRKIYNAVCKDCKRIIYTTAIMNKRRSPDNYKDATESFCEECKKKKEKIIAGA